MCARAIMIWDQLRRTVLGTAAWCDCENAENRPDSRPVVSPRRLTFRGSALHVLRTSLGREGVQMTASATCSGRK